MGARRRSDPFDDLFELATLLPWRMSVAIAVIWFLVLSAVSQHLRVHV